MPSHQLKPGNFNRATTSKDHILTAQTLLPTTHHIPPLIIIPPFIMGQDSDQCIPVSPVSDQIFYQLKQVQMAYILKGPKHDKPFGQYSFLLPFTFLKPRGPYVKYQHQVYTSIQSYPTLAHSKLRRAVPSSVAPIGATM